jgi:hypothetical protein
MIRRILACCGVHGSRDALGWLRRAAERLRPDAVLFAGGILAPGRRSGTRSSPWGLTTQDNRFVEEFFSTLGGLRAFSAVIPGPAGEPLDEFLRLAIQAELAFPAVHAVHATLVAAGDMAVCGIGGLLAEGAVLGLESSTRTTAEYFLRPLWGARQPRKVLLLPSPPPGSLGGPEGLPLVGELIDSLHPDLCVVAGESQRRGSARVGHTLIVNPGRLADGWAAWLDWSRPAEEQLEILSVQGPASAADTGTGASAVTASQEGAGPGRPYKLVGTFGPGHPRPIRSVSEEEIRLRAYLLWEAAGRPSGESHRFWLDAERELRGVR